MPRRSFAAVRHDLLQCLVSGPKTLNLMSRLTGVVWPAVKRHATWLCEQGLARRILSTRYAVIIELTPRGKEEASQSYSATSKENHLENASHK